MGQLTHGFWTHGLNIVPQILFSGDLSITFNYTASYLPGTQPVINEWMAINDSALPDPADGNYDDWMEIYNPGNGVLAFSGYVFRRTSGATYPQVVDVLCRKVKVT